MAIGEGTRDEGEGRCTYARKERGPSVVARSDAGGRCGRFRRGEPEGVALPGRVGPLGWKGQKARSSSFATVRRGRDGTGIGNRGGAPVWREDLLSCCATRREMQPLVKKGQLTARKQRNLREPGDVSSDDFLPSIVRCLPVFHPTTNPLPSSRVPILKRTIQIWSKKFNYNMNE